MTINDKPFIMSMKVNDFPFIRKEDDEMIKCVYPNMVAVMAEKNLSIKDLSAAIDKKPETMRKKMAGVNPFSLNEAIELQEAIFPDVPFKVLFSRKAEIGAVAD